MNQPAQLTLTPAPTAPTEQVIARVSTTLDNGTVVPAIAYDHGRSALCVGHGPTDEFLRSAEALFASLGTNDEEDELEAMYVVQRYALLKPRPNDELIILWNEPRTGDYVDAFTPGAVAVTLIEI